MGPPGKCGTQLTSPAAADVIDPATSQTAVTSQTVMTSWPAADVTDRGDVTGDGDVIDRDDVTGGGGVTRRSDHHLTRAGGGLLPLAFLYFSLSR